MTQNERDQILHILDGIPQAVWDDFLETKADGLADCLKASRAALREAGLASRGPVGKPSAELLALLGRRLLSDKHLGPWLREQLLCAMAKTKWRKLFEEFKVIPSSRAALLHGNMTQHGVGSVAMAQYWRQGGQWAKAFCAATGLPECLAQRESKALPDNQEVESVLSLPPLHDFQVEVHARMRKILAGSPGKTAVLSLPTGAGKTRVTVESICDHLAENCDERRNIVLWIAQSEELLLQAWDCFREVWQVPPKRVDGSNGLRRPGPLRLLRLWGGDGPENDLELGEGPAIVFGGIQKLEKMDAEALAILFGGRLGAVVVDEAHRLINAQHGDVLRALGLRKANRWEPRSDAPPVLGLTATPWRTRDGEDGALRRYFRSQLICPEKLTADPVRELQRRGMLSWVKQNPLKLAVAPAMDAAQMARYRQFHDLPEDYLVQLGENPARNAAILRALCALPKKSRVLLFACSVAHAQVMSVLLNRALSDGVAAVVTGKTPRSERRALIERFRSGNDDLRFLCNVDVLTAGFDAPKVDVVCMTRPTTSAAKYEQMAGRGLRGPKNGGTASCIVMDVQDEGMPQEVLSYGRVMGEWRG